MKIDPPGGSLEKKKNDLTDGVLEASSSKRAFEGLLS
jgi:hypothetical protein